MVPTQLLHVLTLLLPTPIALPQGALVVVLIQEEVSTQEVAVALAAEAHRLRPAAAV